MNNGRTRGINIPGIKARDQHVINRAGMEEGIWQPLYDYQTYTGSSGHTSLQFFQNPIGQNNKTREDTNMESAGQLPRPKFFLLTSLHVVLFPGVDPVQEQSAADAGSQWNDVYTFAKSGYLDLFAGSKSYLQDGPLGRFPPDFRLAGVGALADSTTTAADNLSKVDYATTAGPNYSIVPILLEPNQNFSVTLNWSSAVPLPSGTDARVGVFMNGYLYRLSQ